MIVLLILLRGIAVVGNPSCFLCAGRFLRLHQAIEHEWNKSVFIMTADIGVVDMR